MAQADEKPTAQQKMDEIVQATLKYNQAKEQGKSPGEVNTLLENIKLLEKELEQLLQGNF